MIKAGNWVNVIINVEDGKVVHNRIAKCHHVWNGLVYYFNGDRIVYAIEENVEKLPIKFKGFNIVMCYARNWECYRNTKSIGKIHFVCIQEGAEYFTGFKVPHESFVIKYCNTIQQSELWLELQYAILLAKARGLV